MDGKQKSPWAVTTETLKTEKDIKSFRAAIHEIDEYCSENALQLTYSDTDSTWRVVEGVEQLQQEVEFPAASAEDAIKEIISKYAISVDMHFDNGVMVLKPDRKMFPM